MTGSTKIKNHYFLRLKSTQLPSGSSLEEKEKYTVYSYTLSTTSPSFNGRHHIVKCAVGGAPAAEIVGPLEPNALGHCPRSASCCRIVPPTAWEPTWMGLSKHQHLQTHLGSKEVADMEVREEALEISHGHSQMHPRTALPAWQQPGSHHNPKEEAFPPPPSSNESWMLEAEDLEGH